MHGKHELVDCANAYKDGDWQEIARSLLALRADSKNSKSSLEFNNSYTRISIRFLNLHISFFRGNENELCISSERIVIWEKELSNLMEPFCGLYLENSNVPSGLLLFKIRKAYLAFDLVEIESVSRFSLHYIEEAVFM